MSDTLEFLEALYGKDTPGYLALWTPQPNRVRWIAANNLSKAAETAVELGRRGDVYFGLGLHAGDRGPHKRGEAESVIAITSLWADIDVEGEAHKGGNLPPTGEEAMKIIDAFPLCPTLIIHSGHGLQVWWFFKELWVFEDETERKEAQ